jgi:hypothetical protein
LRKTEIYFEFLFFSYCFTGCGYIGECTKVLTLYQLYYEDISLCKNKHEIVYLPVYFNVINVKPRNLKIWKNVIVIVERQIEI